MGQLLHALAETTRHHPLVQVSQVSHPAEQHGPESSTQAETMRTKDRTRFCHAKTRRPGYWDRKWKRIGIEIRIGIGSESHWNKIGMIEPELL